MAKFLKDLFVTKDYIPYGGEYVPFVEFNHKNVGAIQNVKDVASAEASTTGPRILFYKQLPSLYGTDLVRISTKGSADPSRTLSVTTSRYVDLGKNKPTLGKLIGNLLGGSANRPSDTIFPANKEGQVIASVSPVSENSQPINGDWSGLKYAVVPGQNYGISQEPAGSNMLTGLLKGNPSTIAQNIAGRAISAGKQQIGNLVTKSLTNKRKKSTDKLIETYDAKLEEARKRQGLDSKIYNTYEASGGKYLKIINMLDKEELIEISKLKIPSHNGFINTNILNERLFDYKEVQSLIEKNTNNTVQYIRIKNLNNKNKNSLIFPAAITDINDNMTPEWNSFKYVGSPFNVYRYNGVERKIGFEFQVYWIGNGQQVVMKDKLNLLRMLVYPDNKLQTITLKDNNYSPLVFTPNLIELSIGDLYKNLKGFVSNLAISVPQQASWATSNPNFLKSNSDIIYPTYVNVTFEMTITENHLINDDNTITYRFDDVNELEGNPTLPTEPVSSIKGGPDNGYNDIGIKPQSQRSREINQLADFANPGLTNSIYGEGGIIRWDADFKNWGKRPIDYER